MKKILLISDTHNYMGEEILKYAKKVDEVWHAGDIGSLEVLSSIQKLVHLRAVYGNIDNHEVRTETEKELFFETEGARVYMTHIGGYPGKYEPIVRKAIVEKQPNIIVTGHSHILKVLHDPKSKALHINPGSIGVSGFHKVRTMIMFEIDNGKPQNMQVIEYNRS